MTSGAAHFDDLWRTKASRHARSRPAPNLRVERALAALGTGHRFLDLGCGDGLLAARLSGRFQEVHGVDISPRAVELARAAGVTAQVVDLGNEPLPYPDGHFDAVTCLSMLQYVRDIERALCECHRVLAPRGELCATIPNMRAGWRVFTLAVLGRFPRTSIDAPGIDGGALHYFCNRDFTALLDRCGFRVSSASGIHCIPRIVERAPDRCLLGAVKREFLSGELFVRASK